MKIIFSLAPSARCRRGGRALKQIVSTSEDQSARGRCDPFSLTSTYDKPKHPPHANKKKPPSLRPFEVAVMQRVFETKTKKKKGKKNTPHHNTRAYFFRLHGDISLVINIYFLFCRTNSVRDLIFV
jgi:hypothetical protein